MDDLPADRGGLREFGHDLRIAMRAWGDGPLLPFMSMAVAGAGIALNEWSRGSFYLWFAGLPLALFTLGWYGAERIWYLQLFRGRYLGPGKALRVAVSFILPFFALGLNIFIVTLPIFVIAFLSGAWEDVPNWLPNALYTFGIDVVATFMTPALAFSTKDAGEARKIGWRMLRQTWPGCAWYALVPPLAIVASLHLAELELGTRLSLTLIATVVALWFKGATAAFYLRRHKEVGDYGSLSEPSAALNT